MKANSPAFSEQSHYPGLDALRGLAILLVIAYHYFSFAPGWIGVDLFFVLSGFLITTKLLATRERKDYYRSFFLRRVLRIFPLYFLVLGIFFFSAPFIFSIKSAGSVYDYYSSNQLWFWTFTQNWLIIKEGIPPEPYLQHFWSLAVEEQFYLVWPFLIALIPNVTLLKKLLAAIFLFALFFRFFLHLNQYGFEPFYYNTFARMDSLAAGAFLAVIQAKGYKISKGQTLVVYLLFAIYCFAQFGLLKNWSHNNVASATIGYSIYAVFFMVICYQMKQSASAIAQSKLLRYVGRISFGLYVYHIPILLVLSKVIKEYIPGSSSWNAYTILILALIITVFTSIFSFMFIELPFLRLKKKFT